MLERDEIRLSPEGGVFDAADGSPLGRVAAVRAPRWLGGRPRLFVVTEGADGSLVFSARRGWLGRTWAVAEAEGNPVAWLRGGQVLTADGRLLARYHAAARGGGRCRGWDGAEWAAWAAEAGGVRLHFGGAIRGEPFLKMAALACVLVEANPGR